MPLDQVENFVEVNVSGTHSSTETIISLQSGEASNLPDPASGEFNLVWFDSTNFSRPSEDNSVEIVRVTGRDITNDTITVLRGQENTTAVAHDTSNSDYVMILAQTAKMIEDVDAADFSTNTVTVAGNSVALGSSTAVNHSDLSNIGTGDHHTRYSDEEAKDAVGGILNADFSYNDAGNSIALASTSLSVAEYSVALGGSTAVATGDLSDQNITTPSAGQTILYDASAGEFVNGFISTGTALGSTSGDGVFTLNVQEGNISHDNLSGYVANEHIDHSTVTISAGTHLTGGGDLTASRTLNVDETGIDATNLDGSAGSAGQFLQTDGSNLTFASVSAKAFEEVADFASIPSNPETGEGFTTTDKGELFVEVNN